MTFRTSLMPHQEAAVKQLFPWKVGALFMDMGTGKSRTAMELASRRESSLTKVIWFCPVSLKETIREQIETHVVATSVHVFDDTTAEGKIPEAFWHVVGIESMSSSARVILAVQSIVDEHTFVIVDESSYIKGHRSKRTEMLYYACLKAKFRLIMTGTPMSQGVEDLFSQFYFLDERILGYKSFFTFARNHLIYSNQYPNLVVGTVGRDTLASRVAPYVFQIRKDECLTLPEKSYVQRTFRMTEEQRHYYEEAKSEFLEKLIDDEFDSYLIFQLFSNLQQIVCGFWNRTGQDGTKQSLSIASNRVDLLSDAVSEIARDEKIIIWAKYIHDIRAISERLRIEFGEEAVAEFHGQLTPVERTAQIGLFRNKAKFFISIPKSGGHGLTLNEAAYAIYYNNEFQYSNRLQSEDRNHRIGQTRKTTYIDLVCEKSIDERIHLSMAAKESVISSFRNEVDRLKGKKSLREIIGSL